MKSKITVWHMLDETVVVDTLETDDSRMRRRAKIFRPHRDASAGIVTIHGKTILYSNVQKIVIDDEEESS